MGEEALLVGRATETRMLTAAVEASAAGSPIAILVAGEAGAGKTRLVREATDAAAVAGHVVLWGSCLRYAADTSPFLPIGRLLTQWHHQATPAEHDRVLAGAEPLATIAPALGTPDRAVDPGQLIPLAAAVLDRIVAGSPTVLVVDDLQWADSASLDLLAYLLAGFAPGQRLAVLATYRDTDLVDGHRLHGWLADTLRLPAVQRLRLERLGLTETEELVAGIVGRSGLGGQGAEVFARSDGNPYLTELLARHAAGPQDVGDGLDQMLLASWHRLGDAAREVLQVLAVGGRPVDVEVIERVAGSRGLGDVVRPSIAEAVGEGLVIREAGRVWFHHPLVAEVIASTVEPADLIGIHQSYVAVLEADTELAAASRAAHLALHHHAGSQPDEAFAWSLRAADEALRVRAFDEVSGHLHRACELWERVSDEERARAGERSDLLARASVGARSAGDYPLAIRLREQAIALVDPETDPVRAVRLRLPLHQLQEMCGLVANADVEVSESILELAERCPGTAEQAIALASLANAEYWNGRPEAAEHAEQAVQLAIEVESDEALATALGTRAQTRFGTPEGLEDAERAVALADSTGDGALLGTAGFHRALAYFRLGRVKDVADSLLGVYRRIVSVGSVHDAMYSAPAITVLTLADVGRMAEARGLLRELLSRRLAPDETLDARICAAVLALRTGDEASARNHLARVEELLPRERVAGRFVNRVEIQARCLAGEADQALDLVETLMPGTAEIGSSMADELLLWATRSCADLAESPDRRPEALARLDRVEQLRGDGPRFEACGPDDLLHPTRGRIHAAERARCLGDDPDLSALWAAAATSCAEAGLVWEEALARYRLAQAVLTTRGARDVAASALRRAGRIATDIDARPIIDDVIGLARQARIPLEEPSTPEAGVPTPPDSVWTKLTSREREVLSHLVAGRTYAEIAAALFISEKTVSVHVSNVLRKTGTSNRIEVAELARGSADNVPTGPLDKGTGRP
jgi:DNA-binding CsgD family transcriptional regulator/tetratricopeptide (TPR) repeat protein